MQTYLKKNYVPSGQIGGNVLWFGDILFAQAKIETFKVSID